MTDAIVRLNVGGRIFETTESTLRFDGVDNFFTALTSDRTPSLKDSTGAYFIDRDPDFFTVILRFLRTRKVYRGTVPVAAIYDEALFYSLGALVEILESKACKSEFISVGCTGPSDVGVARAQTASRDSGEGQTACDIDGAKETGCESGLAKEARCESGLAKETGCESGLAKETGCESGLAKETGCESGLAKETGCESGLAKETTNDVTTRDAPLAPAVIKLEVQDIETPSDDKENTSNEPKKRKMVTTPSARGRGTRARGRATRVTWRGTIGRGRGTSARGRATRARGRPRGRRRGTPATRGTRTIRCPEKTNTSHWEVLEAHIGGLLNLFVTKLELNLEHFEFNIVSDQLLAEVRVCVPWKEISRVDTYFSEPSFNFMVFHVGEDWSGGLNDQLVKALTESAPIRSNPLFESAHMYTKLIGFNLVREPPESDLAMMGYYLDEHHSVYKRKRMSCALEEDIKWVIPAHWNDMMQTCGYLD